MENVQRSDDLSLPVFFYVFSSWLVRESGLVRKIVAEIALHKIGPHIGPHENPTVTEGDGNYLGRRRLEDTSQVFKARGLQTTRAFQLAAYLQLLTN
jgi:hypothetical protein